jgi:hypothetical protein
MGPQMIISKRLVFLLIILLSSSLISAKGSELMTLTIINKSGQQVAVRLITPDNTRFYYLPVPIGDSTNPSQTKFTIFKTLYRMRLVYFERYDPKTGYECPSSRSATLIAGRNIRVTVVPCLIRPCECGREGEPTMVKMGCFRCIR